MKIGILGARMAIEYHAIETIADLEHIIDLEKEVWQMSDREAVPVNILHAVVHSGGCVIGAYDAGKLIGFALAILARDEHEFYLWSHMAAVQPSYQAQGIGFQLKQAQRQWALARGYQTMRWTFDPLLRGNANFNLHRLGAVAKCYHINFYGEMRDGLNAGMDSDRLEVTWHLNDARVIAHAAEQIAPVDAGTLGDFLLAADADNQPLVMPTTKLDAPFYRVEIPYHFSRLKQTNRPLATAWQEGLRTVLRAAFAQGYTAVDFWRQGEKCWYVLRQ